MAYCDYTMIQALLTLTFDTNSLPTATKVGEMIDMIASEINMYLQIAGVVLPVTDSNLLNILKLKTAQGVAGIVATGYPRDNMADGQGGYYSNLYNEFLKLIKTNPEIFKLKVANIQVSSNVLSGATDESSLNPIEDRFDE